MLGHLLLLLPPPLLLLSWLLFAFDALLLLLLFCTIVLGHPFSHALSKAWVRAQWCIEACQTPKEEHDLHPIMQLQLEDDADPSERLAKALTMLDVGCGYTTCFRVLVEVVGLPLRTLQRKYFVLQEAILRATQVQICFRVIERTGGNHVARTFCRLFFFACFSIGQPELSQWAKGR